MGAETPSWTGSQTCAHCPGERQTQLPACQPPAPVCGRSVAALGSPRPHLRLPSACLTECLAATESSRLCSFHKISILPPGAPCKPQAPCERAVSVKAIPLLITTHAAQPLGCPPAAGPTRPHAGAMAAERAACLTRGDTDESTWAAGKGSFKAADGVWGPRRPQGFPLPFLASPAWAPLRGPVTACGMHICPLQKLPAGRDNHRPRPATGLEQTWKEFPQTRPPSEAHGTTHFRGTVLLCPVPEAYAAPTPTLCL